MLKVRVFIEKIYIALAVVTKVHVVEKIIIM